MEPLFLCATLFTPQVFCDTCQEILHRERFREKIISPNLPGHGVS